MSGKNLQSGEANFSSVMRPSKLPLLGRRGSQQTPITPQYPAISTIASPISRACPVTIVKPYFSAHQQAMLNNEAPCRRYPASQPSTPVHGNQFTKSPFRKNTHFVQPIFNMNSDTAKKEARNTAFTQSTSSTRSPCITTSNRSPAVKIQKPNSNHVENMSVEHLRYLERRLQQLLESRPPKPAPIGKAMSDSGVQAPIQWVRPVGRWLVTSADTVDPHYPHVAANTPTKSFQFYPKSSQPLFPYPPTQVPQQSHCHAETRHDGVGGECPVGWEDAVDPSYLASPVSSSTGANTVLPSSIQDFNKNELSCLLHAVQNMLSMHQRNSSNATAAVLSSSGTFQRRPYSWYFHQPTIASGVPTQLPASTAVNHFFDDDDESEGLTVVEKGDEGNESARNEDLMTDSDESGSCHRPPLLPAGFRNFSRYLDTKFGPDVDCPRDLHSRRRTEALKPLTSPCRGKNVASVHPKIAISTYSSDADRYSEVSLSPKEIAQHVPHFKPPRRQHRASSELRNTVSKGQEEEKKSFRSENSHPGSRCYSVSPTPQPKPQSLHCVPPTPPPPLPPPPPPHPLPSTANAAAACWFRAAANHFATAAAIFAADNAAAVAASMAPRHHLPPIPPSSAAAYSLHPFYGNPRVLHNRGPAVPSFSPIMLPEGLSGPINHHHHPHHPAQYMTGARDSAVLQQPPPDRLPLHAPFWNGRRAWSPVRGNLNWEDGNECALDMLPQDPALILPDQFEFYAQIKDLLELDGAISLPLPPGWAIGVSSSGRRFYVSCSKDGTSGGEILSSSSHTGEGRRITMWQHPVIAPRIPLAWERVEMRRGNCVYYRHLLIPHTQRHHPDLWFPANSKNVELERQSWFLDLRKLQESVLNFDKGNSHLIESYVDAVDPSEEIHFSAVLERCSLHELEDLLKHLDCRFFRDLHRVVVAFELARIRIVRELFAKQHINHTSTNPLR